METIATASCGGLQLAKKYDRGTITGAPTFHGWIEDKENKTAIYGSPVLCGAQPHPDGRLGLYITQLRRKMWDVNL
jgi:hypothetical protein